MNPDNNQPGAAPEGHPVHTLMEEHRMVLGFASKLIEATEELRILGGFNGADAQLSQITGIVDHLKASRKHYLREENILFPYLEKHGVSGPPSQMWAEHDQIRETEKTLFSLLENREKMGFSEFTEQLAETAIALSSLLETHFHKENNILFPMAMRLFTDQEWQETVHQFAEIGYCCFTPKSAIPAFPQGDTTVESKDGSTIDTGSGSLSKDQLVAMLNTLPVEITFVNKDDVFSYFNQVEDPIFVRTVAAVGTAVQNCHPRKSVHMVNKIITDFKSGARDEVSFWIQLKGKFVYIRYFAVRDKNGEYLGCMEVSQDIKDIQKIRGEKRLMD